MKLRILKLCFFSILAIGLQAQSAIQEHIAQNDIRAIHKWLKTTQNINAPFNLGEQRFTPLQYACSIGQVETALLLLNTGANVNVLSNGQDALMFAAQGGNREIVEALLSKGANPLNENSIGQSARDIAKSKGHEDITNLLQLEIENRLAAMRAKRHK